MKPKLLYRIAFILLLLWAIGHSFGFRAGDPAWRADALITSMQSLHFNAQGFDRTYWDFFVGFGFYVSVFLLFTAFLAWQLGGLPPETLARLRGTTWALALSFVALTILSWKYFFILALVFSGLITLLFLAAAWQSTKPKPQP